MVEAVAQGFQLDGIDNLSDEGHLEEHACFLLGDAPLAHVEEGGIVELAYSRAMGTLHVIGIYLEHRLGEHVSLFRGSQVLVGHLRDRLLCPGSNIDLAGKGASGLFVEHILIEFVAGAVAGIMRDERIVVHMLVLVGNHAAAQPALSPLAVQFEVEFIACDTVVESDDVMHHPTVGLLVHIDIAQPHILGMRLLQTVELHPGIVAGEDLDDLRGEEVAVVGRMVTEEQRHLRMLLGNDEDTAVEHQGHPSPIAPRRGGCFEDIDDLYGALHLHAPGHIYQQSVLRQHRVEVSDGVAVLGGQSVVTVTHQFRMLRQRPHDHPFRQSAGGQILGTESVVDDEIE